MAEIDADTDTTFGDEVISSTKSLAPSIEDYVFENGRRYHAYRSGQYMYPNDELEADREDLKHHATRLLLDGRLCCTSFSSSPQNVLDIGTGTGIWAMQFADDHPESQIVGIDLSPIQPKWVPPNLEFQVDDIEQEWTFNDNDFDFIHVRYMASAIRDWPQLLRRCRRALRPRGQIELVDMDLTFTSDDGTVADTHCLTKFVDDMTIAAGEVGCDLRVAGKFEDLLREAGFREAQSEIFKIPMGPWAKNRKLKTVGLCHREQFLQGLSGIATGLFTRVLHWTADEIEVYLALVRADIVDARVHGYWKSYHVTAEVASDSPSLPNV